MKFVPINTSSHMGTYAKALKNRDFLDLIISVKAYWALYLSALYMYVKFMEGIVISSLTCRMSCSPTPVPQKEDWRWKVVQR